jgi:hypothetical protein
VIARRKPLRRSRIAPKPRKPLSRGKRPNRVRKTPRAALVRKADKLWSLIVRNPGRCYFADDIVGNSLHVCAGALQGMHGIPRTYHATRWELINGFCGCQAVHYYYTRRPEAWSARLVTEWGLSVFQSLWSQANRMAKVDMEAVVAKLEAEWARIQGSKGMEGV